MTMRVLNAETTVTTTWRDGHIEVHPYEDDPRWAHLKLMAIPFGGTLVKRHALDLDLATAKRLRRVLGEWIKSVEGEG